MLRSYVGIGIAVAGLWAGSEFCRAQAPAPRSRAPRRSTKLAPPPKWDKATLETFAADARQRLGPEPTNAPLGQNERAASAPTDAPPKTLDAATAGGVRWSGVISAATLEDEVKAQAQPLATAVQSPTGFNGGGYKAAREELTMLAVLFAVIGQYDGEVRWQKQATSMRDLFGRAGMNCKASGDNTFKEAKLRSQDLADLIRGGAVETRPADEEFQWPDVADRSPVMKRMEKSLRERLGPWTAGASEFRKNRDAILREAELLALLARVIRAEGYTYADDPTYRQYVDDLERECRDIIEAVNNGNLQQAQSAASQMNKTCDACHGDFRS